MLPHAFYGPQHRNMIFFAHFKYDGDCNENAACAIFLFGGPLWTFRSRRGRPSGPWTLGDIELPIFWTLVQVVRALLGPGVFRITPPKWLPRVPGFPALGPQLHHDVSRPK